MSRYLLSTLAIFVVLGCGDDDSPPPTDAGPAGSDCYRSGIWEYSWTASATNPATCPAEFFTGGTRRRPGGSDPCPTGCTCDVVQPALPECVNTVSIDCPAGSGAPSLDCTFDYETVMTQAGSCTVHFGDADGGVGDCTYETMQMWVGD